MMGRPFCASVEEATTPTRLVLLVVVLGSLRVVFALVVPRRGRLADDLLARVVGYVGEVGEHGVVALAADDHVLLAVAGVEPVVSVAAQQRGAEGVVRARDVMAKQ